MLTCVLTNEPGEGGLNRRERSKKKKLFINLFCLFSYSTIYLLII